MYEINFVKDKAPALSLIFYRGSNKSLTGQYV